MRVIETAPTYYRVQLPSGQVMTIARTAGTEALVQSEQSLAGGGVIAPEFLEPEPDPFAPLAQTPLMRQDLAGDMPPVVGGGGPLSTIQMPRPTLGMAADVLTGGAAGVLMGNTQGAMPGGIVDAGITALADLAAPVKKVANKVTNYAKDVAAAPIGTAPKFGTSEAAAAAAPAAEEKPAEGGDSFYADIQSAFDPLVMAEAPAAPAGPAPSSAGLAEAQAATAADQNYYQGEIAKTLAANQPGPAPAPTPVNPKQFYEQVGNMFGATNPHSARIIGGIAAGLVQAMGAFGAALTHGQNNAAQMIQQAVADNIASQQGANALSRQQWVDQTTYANALVGRKIDELTSMAKGQESIDRAKEAGEKMKLDLALASYRGLAQKGAISADTAGKLSDIELVRGAGRDLAGILGTFPSGWWANFDDKRLPGDDQNVKRANASMTVLNNRIESMLKTRGKLPGEEGEATRGLEALKITLADTQQTIKTKLQAIANMARQQQAVVRAAGAGVDPSGATLPTPGARPN